jgi:hypothetical protein
VILFDSSGCWAIALSAWATARPCPKAGPIAPIAMVKPALITDAIPINVIVSIFFTPISTKFHLPFGAVL